MKRWVLPLLLSLVLLGISAFWPGTGASWVQLDVTPGTSAIFVARQLVDRGQFFSVYPMIFWTKVMRADQKIKVGRYRFNKGRSSFWVVSDLIRGHTEKIHLTIPEGFASWQIADRLERRMVCSAQAFLKLVNARNLEGFLFPATYDFDVGIDPREVVKTLTDRFNQVWSQEMTARTDSIGWSKNQAVTMASILEREARDRTELSMISAVYHNRLKKRMRLEADPTVQYALGFWKKRILYADINKTESPYNTYLHSGLPPGPICNPGLEALKAALWPAESEALYFVARPDGRHDFSKTYKEHSQKVKMRDQMRKKR